MKSAAYILSYIIMLPLAVAVFFIVMFLCCVATESFLQVARTLTGPPSVRCRPESPRCLPVCSLCHTGRVGRTGKDGP